MLGVEQLHKPAAHVPQLRHLALAILFPSTCPGVPSS